MLLGRCLELLVGTAWGLLVSARRLGELDGTLMLGDRGVGQGAPPHGWVTV